MMFGNIMYLRPGNLWKSFRVLKMHVDLSLIHIWLDSPDRADALALALYLGKIKKHTGTAPGVKELQELTKDNYWG